MLTPIEEFTNFWQDIFTSDNPSERLQELDGKMPVSIATKVNTHVYPESYYGYLGEDISSDVILLLINPGYIEEDDDYIQRYNAFIKHRHLHWTKAEYLQEDKLLGDMHPAALRWRNVRKRQAENILHETIGFLHTIEFYPYHSKKWAVYKPQEKNHIYSIQSTNKAFRAITYLAKSRRPKAIFAIGKPWLEIFTHYGFKSKNEEISKPNSKRFSHKFHQFRVRECALPIVVYINGAGGMNLPCEDEATNVMRRLLKD
jgi:hypothetical protein